jgi:hypothetical protein
MSKDIIERYKEQRDLIRNKFRAEKVGDQTLFSDQTKLFKPIIESQKETQDKLVSNQNTLSNALVPFIDELKRRNDQVEDLQALPFYAREGDHSTPKSKDIMIDINGELLNHPHIKNLEAMNFELPSIVQEKGTMEDTLKNITTKKRSLNQLTGKTGEKDLKQKKKCIDLKRIP